MNQQAEIAINWVGLAPIIIVLGTGALQVLFEAFIPRGLRRTVQLITSLVAIILAFAAAVVVANAGIVAKPVLLAGTDVVGDLPGLVAQFILLIIGALAVLVAADLTSAGDGAFASQPADRPGSSEEALSDRNHYQRTEYFPLMLFSLGGMMVFVQASSLLTMFVALEVMSLPLYILSASARRQRLISQEAGIKYFLLGAFASGFFLFGSAFLYGATGTMSLATLPSPELQPFIAQHGLNAVGLWMVGVIMVMVGLLFKVAAVPFHAWTPDVYQGAPSPITGFMAAGVKVAAFLALMRLVGAGLPGTFPYIRIFVWVIAALTIVVGTVMGLRQTNIKRLLAYSSVAHAGFLLLALMDLNGELTHAWPAVLFYLLTYGVATVGAFGVISLVRKKDASGAALGEAGDLANWAGLAKTNPLLALAMTVFLLSFAGIPLTAGFIGKFWLFMGAFAQGGAVLVVIAVLASAATAVFYFRVIRQMYLAEPAEDTIVVSSEGFAGAAIVLATLMTVLLGLAPTLFFNLLA
ncbi:NADH-quinone oxidoreductase subunit N [Boudabousia tangfeifanii]|uniref:NADH-quinone oxidoreductase subunit N n=1 Tax=Boudabousia tangfeifanii TaxID=1912795 RepID=A0A1D9MIS0_9ACTO|nr:NADH-quinone oxidoreductase subunit NuoN [Boudabousia tangfeifanii]AOZ72194.1 NADH-quinone oxidoreductase subunit N [Boudabousia tangfeifanii]